MSDITIQRLNGRFDRWDALLDLILASFAYMNGRIDPPSSALALTPAALKMKARSEIAYIALNGERLERIIAYRNRFGIELSR